MRGTAADRSPIRAPSLATSPTHPFEELYRSEALNMVRLAFLMVGSQQFAEEIAQDAFAQVFERWDRIERPAAYLRTCVVNGCRTAHRRRLLNRRAEAADRRPHVVLETNHLGDALGSLPARQRSVIVLRYFGDHSEEEIAEVLGVRRGTVKSLLHRGLAQLRKVIDQ